ncbi:MAG: AAA family ATPase [Candidatus Binataceae bacterium]
MKLRKLSVEKFRCLRHVDLPIRDLSVLIGTNASGKSTLLDALRFLKEAVSERDFVAPVRRRGGMNHLAWKGEVAHEILLETTFSIDGGKIAWLVQLQKMGFDFAVQEETVSRQFENHPSEELLKVKNGRGSWWSDSKATTVRVNTTPTACTMAAAAADDGFPARLIADTISKWTSFDPVPELIRRGWTVSEEGLGLDQFGRKLPAILYQLQANDKPAFDRVLAATRSILGVPEAIAVRKDEEEERFYFVQHEAGLTYPVHQLGASAGTLRVLALMTALHGGSGAASLVTIEEPENYVHPGALEALADNLRQASVNTQIILTTHSPLLLDFFSPEDVCVVKRSNEGTEVYPESDATAVRKALEEAGFGLGAFHETKGFGG